HEGGHFFVPRLDESWLIPGFPQCRSQSADSVAGIAINAVDPPLGQPLDDEVADGMRHDESWLCWQSGGSQGAYRKCLVNDLERAILRRERRGHTPGLQSMKTAVCICDRPVLLAQELPDDIATLFPAR